MELNNLQKENFKHLKEKVNIQLKILENKNNEYDELGGNPIFISTLEEIHFFELINHKQLDILRTAYFTRNNPDIMEDWSYNYEFSIRHYMDEEWQNNYSGMEIIKLALEENPNFHGDLNDAIKLLYEVGDIDITPPNGNPIEYYKQGSTGYSEACSIWD